MSFDCGSLCGGLRCGGTLHLDGSAFAHQAHALGHDDLAGRKTGTDDVLTSVGNLLHVNHRRTGLAVDYFIYIDLVLDFERSVLRNDNHVAVIGRHQYVADTSAVKQTVRIGECGTQLHAAGRSVDNAADGLHLARLVIEGAVAERQLHARHILQRSRDGAVLAGQIEQLVLGKREIYVHLRIVRNRRQRLRHRRTDQCAHTVGNGTYHTVRRTLHDRVGEAVACIHLLSLGLSQLGLGRQQRILGGREVELRNHVAGEQLLLAVENQLGGSHRRFGRLHVRLGGLQSRLVGHLVDNEQGLALADPLALTDVHLGDGASHLRIDGDVLATADARRIDARQLAVGGSDFDDGILRLTHCSLLLRAGNGCDATCCQCCLKYLLFHFFHFENFLRCKSTIHRLIY